LPLEVPRDRNGTFEPQIIEKHQTRFTGFDANIISLYARGLSTREIQQHLEEIYHVEVSPALISNVDAVLDEVKTWQNRQLDEVYPIMYLDAIQFKVRDNGQVKNKAKPHAPASTQTCENRPSESAKPLFIRSDLPIVSTERFTPHLLNCLCHSPIQGCTTVTSITSLRTFGKT
jgi:hypothetical protein